MNCRFYKSKLPKKGDYVKVRIIHEDPAGTGYEARLLEYNDHPGYMPMSHISRKRWVRSKKQLADVNKEMFLQVIEVDTIKGYIDLSKKHIVPEREKIAEKNYGHITRFTELGFSIFVCFLSYLENKGTRYDFDQTKEKVFNETIWFLYDQFAEINYEELYQDLLENFDRIWIEYFNGEAFDSEFKEICLHMLKQRMTHAPNDYVLDFNLFCFEDNALECIKNILNIETDSNTSVMITSPPKYKILTTHVSETHAYEILNKIKDKIEEACIGSNVKKSFNEISTQRKGSITINKFSPYHLDKLVEIYN